MTTILQINFVRHGLFLSAAILLSSVLSTNAAAAQDVMLQTMGGKIVTGLVDDQSGAGTLGTRVYGRHFQLVSGSLRASNPGFYGLRTGDPGMPSGAEGFPANHDLNFDLLPMTNGDVSSNLFYWDASDANGGGIDLSDVHFIVPTVGVSWTQFDDSFSPYTVNGTDQLMPGGLIDRTSADIWADGIDSGTFHSHLAMLVNDSDGNSTTTPPAGIFMISWQARSVGFETSDPFFFVMRSPTISDAIRDVAVDWVEANIEMLVSPPSLPGDYNDDDDVDAADYVVWRKNDGSQDRYNKWRANFGATIGSGSISSDRVALPEPTTFALILLAVACRVRRRH